MPQVSDRYRIVPQDLKILIDVLALAQQTVLAARAEAQSGTDQADRIAQELRRKQIDTLLGRINHLKKRFERALAS